MPQTELRKAQRTESLKRAQVGLTGLVGVVLVIALVNIVVDNVRVDNGQPVATAAMNGTIDDLNADASREPLAELGVAPAASPESVVPDLQPDPKLHEPMDRASARPATP